MNGKGEFFQIQRSICNIPIGAANICNILPRLADFQWINCGETEKES